MYKNLTLDFIFRDFVFFASFSTIFDQEGRDMEKGSRREREKERIFIVKSFRFSSYEKRTKTSYPA